MVIYVGAAAKIILPQTSFDKQKTKHTFENFVLKNFADTDSEGLFEYKEANALYLLSDKIKSFVVAENVVGSDAYFFNPISQATINKAISDFIEAHKKALFGLATIGMIRYNVVFGIFRINKP